MAKEDNLKKIVIRRIYELYVAVHNIDTKLSIRDQIRNPKIYSTKQKLKIAQGRAERQYRTHQLIFLGSIWDDFLRHNNISEYDDVKFFQSALSKLKNVNVDEENLILGNDKFDLPILPYTGRDKKIIHYYCQIGGAWESYWRKIGKDDKRDKKIYKIFKQMENGKFDITKIDDDDFTDFNFFCNEKHCKKIGSFNNFFKNRCLKLDEKFFYEFLRYHKSNIIDALVHQ